MDKGIEEHDYYYRMYLLTARRLEEISSVASTLFWNEFLVALEDDLWSGLLITPQ